MEQEKKTFIHKIIEEDLKNNKFNDAAIITRFPPEPNGFLHIGHAKSIFLNFSIAEKYNGICNLRFDDTNPLKESTKFVNAIVEDLKWLGFEKKYKSFYTSDYFDKLYEYAIFLIKENKAYVCDLNDKETKEARGTLTEAGTNSPYRTRSIEENLMLFEKMKNGEFEEGACVLRAKIDMASPNINLRDPVIYRIRKTPHHRTKDKWCIYPMYDFAHCVSDSIEKITHSLCSLEFENNRPLYDWFLENLGIYHSQQIEFARLNISYTILSKRYLSKLIDEAIISSWDDPRMPTISALRRRGCTQTALKNFCEIIGVAKKNSTVDLELFEYCLREDLNKIAKRKLGVLKPLEVVIENYPDGKEEELDAPNNPQDESVGKRGISFSKEIYIEEEDFEENPPKKFFRLSPGVEVRLRYAYFVKCKDVIKDETGKITKIICTYDPETRGGKSPKDKRKVKGTIHWVSKKDCIDAEVRLYDKLFLTKNPLEDEDFIKNINPDSLKIIKGAKLEKSVLKASKGDQFQFERLGYFCIDIDSNDEKIILNKTVGLVDTWKKMQKKT